MGQSPSRCSSPSPSPSPKSIRRPNQTLTGMAPPRSLPELIEDTAAEVLLRVPPDEHAHLVRASLVCKLWRCILLDPAFLRRYREFHRIPPLLGFLRNSITATLTQSFRFVPKTSASPMPQQPASDCARCGVLSCRHGRVRLDTGFYGVELVVWDPITGDLQRLPRSSILFSFYSSAAVLCAAGCCNHLDCHGGPFLVVSVSSHDGGPGELFARVGVHSSETGAWSTPAPLNLPGVRCEVDRNRSGALVGDSIYFSLEIGEKILKFDLGNNSLSMMDPPDLYNCGVLFANRGGFAWACWHQGFKALPMVQRGGSNGRCRVGTRKGHQDSETVPQ